MAGDNAVTIYNNSAIEETKKKNSFSLRVGLAQMLRGGWIFETVGNVRKVMEEIRILTNLDDNEVFSFSKKIAAPYDIVAQTKHMGRLPVVHFAAGGIATSADAALMMQVGCDGVFIGPEIFNCLDPFKKARAIVQAVRNYSAPRVGRDEFRLG